MTDAPAFKVHPRDMDTRIDHLLKHRWGEETDRYWNAIVGNGGQESQCGWCKDRWGFSWQITPRALNEGSADPDPAVRKRVFKAMMTMRKIDVAQIEAARRGA